MMKQRPIFKKKEVVVELKQIEATDFGGVKREQTAEVLYIGEDVTKYKVGQTVLYDHTKGLEEARTIKFFEKELLVLNEELVKCEIVNEDI